MPLISESDLKEFKDRKRYYNMRNVIDAYSESGKRELLTEFERMQLTGCMTAIPPIMGALTLIGYFEDQDVLYWAISYLRGSLGLPQ